MQAQSLPSAWVVGGQTGDRWNQAAQVWIALDDSARPGALQLTQIPPGQNVLRESVRSSASLARNLLGYRWSSARSRYVMGVDTLVLGWHPRIWYGGSATATGNRTLVDGDELTVAYQHAPAAAARTSAITWITLDLGVPVPLDSLVFFPPQNGLTTWGQRLRDLYPEAYEASRTTEPLEWLIYDDEEASTGSNRYHVLGEILGSASSSNQSVVSLSFPLRFTRFLRIRLGGVASTTVLAEIKAFGRGFAQEGRFVSVPRSFGQPVSLGRVTWKFTRYRMARDGQVYEDPAAPVELAVRTRAGTDPDPQAYLIYDEVGRQVEVDRQIYYEAHPPRGSFEEGLSGFRAALTDDIGNWNAWSIPYPESGAQIRSSDGRQYLQFRMEMTTADPLAFGVLDSLAFEISPLLADSVVAEVSLEGQPRPPGRLIEVPLGVDTVFVYDLRTVFGAARPGFDAFELDVPLGTRFLGLEIDGQPASEGEDYALMPETGSSLGIALGQRYTTDTSFRVRLRGAIYQPSVFFGGNLLNRDAEVTALPQSIEAGDARPDVASDGIQVVSSQTRLTVLGSLHLGPGVLTPNGDGINDQMPIQFTVFGVEQAVFRVRVYDLAGRLVATLAEERTGAGSYRPTWDGKDASGSLVSPGAYLVRVEVDVDRDTFSRIQPIAVAY
ncbi:MAG: FlgD immunoglobulin-like domain containing protein [Candidatus Latescibacterota bacterium]